MSAIADSPTTCDGRSPTTRRRPPGRSPAALSISFDLTVTSLFVPLLSGARRAAGRRGGRGRGAGRGPSRRRDGRRGQLTPSHLRALEEGLRPEEVRGWSGTLVIGGEALHAENLGSWRSRAPRMRLVNGTARPRRWSDAWSSRCRRLRRLERCPSGGRAPTPGSGCSTRGPGHCQWAWRASYTSGASRSAAAISAVRT